MINSLRHNFNQFKQAVFSYDTWELAAKLTLLLLLLSPVGNWYIRPLILSLCISGLLISDMYRSRYLWGALTLLTALRFYLAWPLSDNHAYLLSYWCLAFTISAWLKDDTLLIKNAKYLLAFTFAFASWQKWSSVEYLNGVFFLITFILDERFEDFVVLFSSITYEQIDTARDYLEGDYRITPAADKLPFTIPDSFWWLAIASTIWNLFEQLLIAIAFLAPKKSRLGQFRDPALLVFCFSIYAVVPVVSFGWMLIAMGIAQSDKETPSIRLWYLFAFVTLIFYYEVPWADLILEST